MSDVAFGLLQLDRVSKLHPRDTKPGKDISLGTNEKTPSSSSQVGKGISAQHSPASLSLCPSLSPTSGLLSLLGELAESGGEAGGRCCLDGQSAAGCWAAIGDDGAVEGRGGERADSGSGAGGSGEHS